MHSLQFYMKVHKVGKKCKSNYFSKFLSNRPVGTYSIFGFKIFWFYLFTGLALQQYRRVIIGLTIILFKGPQGSVSVSRAYGCHLHFQTLVMSLI